MGTHSSRSSAALFWTYWSAGTVSSVGTAVTTVALPLVAVYVLHASALAVGALTASSYVAWLVIGLPAGALVSRMRLRETQVAMDLLRAAALATIPLAWWLGGLTMLQLVAVALVVSFADVLFGVGNMTLLPAILPKEQLASRNSFMSGTEAVTQLGGPSLGGLVVQLVGAVPTMLVDSVSYLVSAVLMGSLPPREVAKPPAGTGMATMIREGWRFVSRHPVMAPCMWMATVVNFVCGALMALAPVYLVRVLHAPAALVGVLIATEGVGTLLGATVTPRLTRQVGTARALLVAGLVGAFLALLMPAGSGPLGMVLFGVGNAGFAAGVVVLSVTTRTYRQTESPPELLARVMATVRFVSWGAIPFGALAAGAVATALGPRTALWLTSLLTFVPLLVLWASPVRGRRDLAEATTAA